MKEELNGKLVEILTSIQTAAGKASDFALEQLPDIAQSYVMYGRAVSLAHAAVLLLIGGVSLMYSRWAYQNPWNTSDYSWDRDKARSESNYIAMVAPAIVGGLFVITALLSFDYLVWFAPKVWLLKELATLIK